MYTLTNKNWKLFNNQLEYAINEDKGTVACYFKTDESQESVWIDILDDMIENLNNPLGLYPVHSIYLCVADFPKKFGLAKCCPEDTFDIEYGKQLAREQLRDRINRCKLNQLDTLNKSYYHITDTYEKRERSLYSKLVASIERYNNSL